ELEGGVAREDRGLAQVALQADAQAVFGRALGAFAEVLAGAGIGLGRELAVEERRKLLERKMQLPHRGLRRVAGLRCRVACLEGGPAAGDPTPHGGERAALDLGDFLVG